MNVDNVSSTSPAGQSAVARGKTAPFLIRTFVKIGSFHRLSLFEDATLPTTDEQQIFTWKDATLSEVLTTLRETAPHVPEYRHPLARFAFRTVYADSGNKGRFSQKELGLVYSRDILGEPGTLTSIAPRLLEEADNENREQTTREKEERTLDELRFVPGDFLLLAVLLPKNVTMGSDLSIKGSAAQNGPGWKAGGGDGGWGKPPAPSVGGLGLGRGGGHWRGDSNGRGKGGRSGGRGDDKDDKDDRIPPPRSPRRTRGRGWGDRGGRGGRRSPRSRSRSPPRRRGYD
ncbi:Sin3 associated polypeptide p18-domain-containing protein [Lentinula aciculospora]|uniref:Sin3 associated polypeptide p18-domain-containing protein n=1 Tax=Lentinula aciculospora TaxID=153920 RepID=A0A9W9DVR9_9AGAR|nr:Sin3 associated polypeptide p18-domain-containing protein [Lentinula aciculospora]KAJ4488525.1 Sin3 associated polypeptide p18-domain-containing protein [Lentinula aciculospora]